MALVQRRVTVIFNWRRAGGRWAQGLQLYRAWLQPCAGGSRIPGGRPSRRHSRAVSVARLSRLACGSDRSAPGVGECSVVWRPAVVRGRIFRS
jgi:hypothetical protein